MENIVQFYSKNLSFFNEYFTDTYAILKRFVDNLNFPTFVLKLLLLHSVMCRMNNN